MVEPILVFEWWVPVSTIFRSYISGSSSFEFNCVEVLKLFERDVRAIFDNHVRKQKMFWSNLIRSTKLEWATLGQRWSENLIGPVRHNAPYQTTWLGEARKT